MYAENDVTLLWKISKVFCVRVQIAFKKIIEKKFLVCFCWLFLLLFLFPLS